MTHDEMMSLLAYTLADAAGHAGCLPILDCFSPHPGEEVTVSIPMCDDTVDIVLEDLDFPHEWEELLENSGADTMGDLAVMSMETYEEMAGRIELYSKLQEGLADIEAGNTRPFADVMADLRHRRERR